MAGALTTLTGLNVSAAVPGSVDWININAHGITSAAGNAQTMPWTDTLTASISLISGFGSLYYIQNGGAPVTYSGPVAVTNGDTIQWGAQTKSGVNATVTVNRAGPTFVDSFSVSITP